MITDEQLMEVIGEQREAFLRKPFGIERESLQDVEAKIRLPHVIVLTGLRRSGKSTLLRQIAHKYYKDDAFYYVNFEDERLLNFPASEFNRIYECMIRVSGKKKTFLIDEIQNVPNFESFVRRFCDEGFKFIITGSSATLLSKEIGTKLTGRHVDMVLAPFSFVEFLRMKEVNIKNKIFNTETKAEIKKHFDDYLHSGGMPEYLISRDPEVLSRAYEDTILKDIAVRYKIENVSVLRELYQYLITNFANRFSFNSLKKIANLGSTNTIKKYISHLEETYFIKVINKFDYSLKKQIFGDKKIYIIDNGFIEIISRKLTKDSGWLLENMVFSRLSQKNEVFYYSNEKECDFVIVKNKEIKNAIQVCFELNNDNRKREIEGLKEVMQKFKIKEGAIFTHSQEDEISEKGIKIKIIPVWKWLLSS
jgi:hypothetical protein